MCSNPTIAEGPHERPATSEHSIVPLLWKLPIHIASVVPRRIFLHPTNYAVLPHALSLTPAGKPSLGRERERVSDTNQ